MSLLEHDTRRWRQVDKIIARFKLDSNDGKEYKVKAICDSAIYARESQHYILSL